jgi:hypothetical protein
MIRTSDTNFDPQLIIETYLVTPTMVTSHGLIGKFDTLRVALEHLQTHGTDSTVLAIQGPGEELQFAEHALLALLECFDLWLYDAGFLDIEHKPPPDKNPSV